MVDAVDRFIAPPDPPKWPIAFVTPEDKGQGREDVVGKTQDLTPASLLVIW